MNFKRLPLRNLARRPGRTTALLLIVALLAFSIFGGTVVVLSLRSGLDSLEARLGADIIVVPSSAKSKVNLDSLFLQGTTGYYYMNASKYEEIAVRDGIEKVSAQVFLASLRADCCSIPIQVIGIDPETDFSIQPWIAQSYSRTLDERELVVGSRVSTGIGETLRIYGTNCKVVARLESTGTGLDTAVYCSMDTIRLLLDAARELGHDLQITGDPAGVVSAVYIKVQNGVSVEAVLNDINLHVRKVEAVRTKNMITGVSDSLAGVASTITWLVGVVWVLALAVLILAFVMLTNERKREFAVLRVLGTSRRMLAGLLLRESALISLFGGVLGTVLAALVVLPFAGLIEAKLNLPFLLPGVSTMLALAAGTVLLMALLGPLASAWSALRLSRVDAGASLREER